MTSPATDYTRPSLRQQQSLFVKCLGALLIYATQQGYELTLGEGYIQSPRKTRGGQLVSDGVHMSGSLHYVKLAQDLNLFVNGVYQPVDCPEWRDIGEFWETLDPACRWGGRFSSVDLNHFSIGFEGRA